MAAAQVPGTLFGNIELKSPRLEHCRCQAHEEKTFSPLQAILPEHTSPEMLYLEVKWSSLLPYEVLFTAGGSAANTLSRCPAICTPVGRSPLRSSPLAYSRVSERNVRIGKKGAGRTDASQPVLPRTVTWTVRRLIDRELTLESRVRSIHRWMTLAFLRGCAEIILKVPGVLFSDHSVEALGGSGFVNPVAKLLAGWPAGRNPASIYSKDRFFGLLGVSFGPEAAKSANPA